MFLWNQTNEKQYNNIIRQVTVMAAKSKLINILLQTML